MQKRIRVGIIFGGCSPEHEISLLSASNVIRALDPKQFDVVLIGIDKEGRWLLPEQSQPLLDMAHSKSIRINTASAQRLSILPSQRTELITAGTTLGTLDVVFPILHGPLGEDGTIQGLLRFVGIPCVGPNVLASAMCMDKEITKNILMQHQIPTPNFICVRSHEKNGLKYQDVVKKLGSPLFVKPANLGSSVGISKVKDEKSFEAAIEDAFLYDHKILIEEAIIGREIEIGVLGNNNPEVSVTAEAIPNAEFYTYDAKYNDEKLRVVIPAELPQKTVDAIQLYAKKAFQALNCQGMARVDFFVRGDQVYLNELNTIPGFTSSSAFPRLWEASGVPYAKLIERLLALAIEAHQSNQQLKHSY